MYEVPKHAYSKAHLCDVKRLWIEAALRTLDDLGEPPFEPRPVEGAQHHDGTTVELPDDHDGRVMMQTPPVSLAAFRQGLEKQKEQLENWIVNSADLTILKTV